MPRYHTGRWKPSKTRLKVCWKSWKTPIASWTENRVRNALNRTLTSRARHRHAQPRQTRLVPASAKPTLPGRVRASNLTLTTPPFAGLLRYDGYASAAWALHFTLPTRCRQRRRLAAHAADADDMLMLPERHGKRLRATHAVPEGTVNACSSASLQFVRVCDV